MTRTQQFQAWASIISSLALFAASILMMYYAIQLQPTITRMNKISAEVDELLPQYESKATTILGRVDSMVGNATAKVPVWMGMVDTFSARLTPEKVTALVENTLLFVEAIAHTNITDAYGTGMDVITRFRDIVRLDTLQINIPLLGKAPVPP